jgi:predicted glycogen debranching enzyme
MDLGYDKEAFDFAHVHSCEYVEANGLGGYAAGTFSGASSRKEHGLLVAEVSSGQRLVIVSKLDETVVVDGAYHHLGCNQFPGTLYPFGVQYLSNFRRDVFPEWEYEGKGITIRKTIASIDGEDTILVLYEVLEAPDKFTIELRAFYSCRDTNALSRKNEHIGLPFIFNKGVFQTMNYQGCPEFFISVPRSSFIEEQAWWENIEFQREREKAADFREDLYTHGKFVIQLRKNAKLGVILSLTDPGQRDPFRMLREERRRRESMLKNVSDNPFLRRLTLAADQFVVRRKDIHVITADYPSCARRNRDTLISLTGLCLVTRRYAEARKILQRFSEHVHEGLIPESLPTADEPLHYRSIDTALWFIHCVYKYYKYTGEKVFVRTMLPVLRDIIDWYYKGTSHNIHVDVDDELLTGGADGISLTWMDGGIGDWVVTPRAGKAVEVNALWYNALRVMDALMKEFNYQGDSEFYHLKSQIVYNSFNKLFWNEQDACLYDFVDRDFSSRDIRPNQLYALALPFSVLDPDRAFDVIRAVRKHLLTPRGLRSLSSLHSAYRARYDGDVWNREGARHQGTVWSHLTGIYTDALFATLGDDALEEARLLVSGFSRHMNEAGLGTISAVFDGDAPHFPRGAVANSCSVAELLRVSMEYQLFDSARKKHAPSFATVDQLYVPVRAERNN